MEQDGLLEFLNHRLRFCLVGLFEVTGDVEHTTAIGDGYHDTLIHVALILIDLLDDGLCNGLDTLCATVEVADGSLEGILGEHLTRLVDELVAGEGHLH